MDISLSPRNEKFLQSQIAAGIYDSISEAINETLNIAISQMSVSSDEVNLLKQEIAEGLDDIKADRISDGIVFMDELINE